MKYEILPFNEKSLSDAKLICGEMYSQKVFSLLDKVLANPERRRSRVDAAGEIAYECGTPVAFQAAVMRKLYLDSSEFYGVVGSTLCSKPDTSPVLLMQLMRTTIRPRGGGLLFFANTAIPKSSKMNRMLGVKGVASESCGYVRFDVFRFGSFCRFVLKGRMPGFVAEIVDFAWKLVSMFRRHCRKTKLRCEKVVEINASFDVFWKAYIKENKGVVSSRSSEELQWMYQARIEDGKVLMLSLCDRDVIMGYIVAKPMDESRKRWQIIDWIAIGNDNLILNDLLSCMKGYLSKNEPAVWIESIGFPDFIQPLLMKHLPFKRKLKESVFVYQAFDEKINIALSSLTEYNWFWGAYDGDRCF